MVSPYGYLSMWQEDCNHSRQFSCCMTNSSSLLSQESFARYGYWFWFYSPLPCQPNQYKVVIVCTLCCRWGVWVMHGHAASIESGLQECLFIALPCIQILTANDLVSAQPPNSTTLLNCIHFNIGQKVISNTCINATVYIG